MIGSSAIAGTLTFDNQFGQQGSGFGNVLAVTTAHRTDQVDNSTIPESSCVGWGGAADIYTCAAGSTLPGGDHSTTGAPQNTTYEMSFLLSEIGIDSVSEVGLVVNPSQTGANPSITLTGLYFAVYDTDGSVLYRFDWLGAGCSPFDGTCVLDQDNLGIGGQGFGFRIVDGELAALAGIWNADWRIGAGVSFLNWDDGPDTVNIARFAQDDLTDVPEPSTMLLMGGSLLGFAYFRRRKDS